MIFNYVNKINEVETIIDDDEVRFVLDQHAELDFYNAISLKQQSADEPTNLCSFSLMLHA
jgi:hypothetical protein